MVLIGFAPLEKVKRLGESLKSQDFQVMSAVFGAVLFVCGLMSKPDCKEMSNLSPSGSSNASTAFTPAATATENQTPANGNSATSESCKYDVFNAFSTGGALAMGALYTLLVTNYVNGAIAEGKREKEKELKQKAINVRQELNQEAISARRYSDEPWRINPELDFLSEYAKELGLDEEIQSIKTRGLSDAIRDFKDGSELDDEVKRYRENAEFRQQALLGLEKGFSPDPNRNKKKFFMIAIVKACNSSLGLKTDKFQEQLDPFYKDIYACLKAWLVTSLKWATPIPIVPSIQDTEEFWSNQNFEYKGYESYIAAIDFLISVIREHDYTRNILPEPKAREVVVQYLEEFKKLLREAELPKVVDSLDSKEASK